MTEFQAEKFKHLVELLHWRATANADERAITYLVDGENNEIWFTYQQLDERARAIGAWLQAQNAQGERVLLLYPPSLDYVAAYFGCLYAGAIAVPAYPPRRQELSRRLETVVSDAGAKFIFSTGDILDKLDTRFEQMPALQALSIVATENISNDYATAWQMPDIRVDDLAFLQYTSGSTSAPKGVMVSHGNLMANESMIRQGFEHTERPTVVSWLPIYHDMGLIGNILQPIYMGSHAVVMSPTAFIQRPIRWLQAISKYRGNSSGGPNFGYDLCTQKISAAERANLDLSSWTVAYNGAEPIRAETLRKFTETFADCGFAPEAFYPCYGLAEATLFVTGGPKTKKPRYKSFSAVGLEQNQVSTAANQAMRELVSSGPVWGQDVAIVDPDTMQICPPDKIGEVWIHGANVAKGYWGNPEMSAATFNAFTSDSGQGPFLRTGDLGFFSENELFVTGRIKDMLIIRGRNHYPQDIELTVEKSHPALRPSCTAAFSIDVNGEEQLVVVQELEREHRLKFDADKIFSAILEAVGREHEIQPHAIVLINTLSILKTSSGKIQRRATRKAFLENTLEILATWNAPAPAPKAVAKVQTEPTTVHIEGFHNPLYPAQNPSNVDDLLLWLRDYASTRINSRIIDERRTIPPYVVLDMGNRGLLGIQVPESHGGLGLGYSDNLRVIKQLGGIDQTLALFVGLGNILGTYPILRHASQEIRDHMLPLLARGRELGAFALTELGAGSNPNALASRAVPNEKGGLNLFGQKIWSGVASWAGVLNVFAREYDAKGNAIGMSAFVLRQGSAGLRQGPEALTMGMRGMIQNTVFLEGVAVSDVQRLGAVGEGFAVAQDAMSYGRLAIAAACVGSMQHAAQLMLRYASRREVATGNLLNNPVTRMKLSELTAAIDALDSLVMQTGQALDNNINVPVEIFTAAKIAGPELAWWAADTLAQMLGGRGYIETNLVPQMLRDVRILRVFEGPTETLQLFLGSHLLNHPEHVAEYMQRFMNAPQIFGRLETALAEISDYTMASGLFDNEIARKQWLYKLCGDLSTYAVLMAASHNAFLSTKLPRYQRALGWAEAHFERIRAAALAPSRSQKNLLLGQADLAQLVDTYQDSIGLVEQSLAGEDYQLDELLRLNGQSPAPQVTTPKTAPSPIARPSSAQPSQEAQGLRSWILDWMAKNMEIARNSVDASKSFAEYGMDSIKAVEFAHDLETWLGGRLEIDEVATWNYPTLNAMVEYVSSELSKDSKPLAAKAVKASKVDAPTPNLDQLSDEDLVQLLTKEIEASRKQTDDN